MKPEAIGRYTLEQWDTVPPISRDSLLLGGFAAVRRGSRVCDLGCGSGVLALLLANRQEKLTLDGIDCQEDCVRLTERNLRNNGLSGTVRQGFAENPPFSPGEYDLVISNPPYFTSQRGKAAESHRGTARTMEQEQIPLWCGGARRLLRNGGRFAFCIRPDLLSLWMSGLAMHHLEPKRMQMVQSAPEKNANLVLIEAAAQGRPGLTLLPVRIMR